jgi:hypothetical protein
MKSQRKCPSCSEYSISVAKLAFLQRLKCSSCKSKIGFNWIFSGSFYCLSAVLFGFLGIYLSVSFSFSLIFNLVVLVISFVVLSFLVGLFAPLEIKQKWWEP